MNGSNHKQYDKIGLVAGDGNLPKTLIDFCVEKEIKIVVAIVNPNFHFDKELELKKVGVEYQYFSIGSVGKIFKYFRQYNIQDISFAGRVRKPQLSGLKVDFRGLLLLMRVMKSKLYGDDMALKVIAKYVEKNGFNLVGIDEIMPDLLANIGAIGEIVPDKKLMGDIEYGIGVAKKIGDLDIGQSVIIQQGVVIGVEAIEGTDKLIKRCGELKYNNIKRPPILVKVKKPNQERRIDLPTIGLNTIDNVIKAGIRGVVLESGSTLILDKKKVIELADKNGIFIFGY